MLVGRGSIGCRIATRLWHDVRSTQFVIKMQYNPNDATWLLVSRTDNVRASEDRPIVGDEAGAYDGAVRIQSADDSGFDLDVRRHLPSLVYQVG